MELPPAGLSGWDSLFTVPVLPTLLHATPLILAFHARGVERHRAH